MVLRSGRQGFARVHGIGRGPPAVNIATTVAVVSRGQWTHAWVPVGDKRFPRYQERDVDVRVHVRLHARHRPAQQFDKDPDVLEQLIGSTQVPGSHRAE